jgi:hypothetical protein
MKEFKKAVEDYLMDKYYITINDITDEKQIEQAFNDGETPQEFVEWLAEKYDLIDFKI